MVSRFRRKMTGRVVEHAVESRPESVQGVAANPDGLAGIIAAYLVRRLYSQAMTAPAMYPSTKPQSAPIRAPRKVGP